MNKQHRQRLSYALSTVIGIGLLGGVVYYVGWRSILTQIHALGNTGIITVVGNVLLTVLTWIVGWWVILRSYGITVSLRTITWARLSGYAVSYLTPSLYFGGEPIRALMIADRTSAPVTRIFATIVVERFLGGLSLIVFIFVGSFYTLITPQVNAGEKRTVIIGVAFITFWIVVGLINFARNSKWISRPIRLLERPFRRWRNGIERAANKVSETEDEIHEAFTRHWRGTLLAFLIQILSNFFVYMRPQVFFYFSAHRLFDFAQLSLLFTLNIMLSFFLWITPGGLGTGEAALIGIYKLVGVGKEGAVAFSLTFKFVELLIVMVGLFYLFHKGIGRLFSRFKERAHRH
jgi:uncharacterized protein (TIRG00374 family)